MSNTLIETHTIRYSSNSLPPSIQLYNGQTQVGILLFHPNTSTLPSDKQAGDVIVLNYHAEDFTNIRHMLRTEEPVYLVYTGPDRGSDNGIVTVDPDGDGLAKKAAKKKK